LFEDFMLNGKDVSHFVGSHEINVEGHMEVQAIVQKHVDNAVSKTINLANDYPMGNMEKLWLDYLPRLKGTTFYREGTRGFVDKDGKVLEPPLKSIPLKEAMYRFKELHSVSTEVINDCASGLCEI